MLIKSKWCSQIEISVLGLSNINNCSILSPLCQHDGVFAKPVLKFLICQRMKKLESDIMEKIFVQTKYETCLKPCKKIEYVGNMNMAHQNSRKLMPHQVPNASQYVGVWVQYDSFIVQEQQEYFILDGNELVSSIGGFLGMFLGFSTLSIAEWIHFKIKMSKLVEQHAHTSTC